MYFEHYLLTNEWAKTALILAVFVPFGLVFTSVAHGWRLKRAVDDDFRQRIRQDRDHEAKVLAELIQSQ